MSDNRFSLSEKDLILYTAEELDLLKMTVDDLFGFTVFDALHNEWLDGRMTESDASDY